MQKKDDSTEQYLETKHSQHQKRPPFFGAVQLKKSYVSYHLMPVYLKPELQAGVSPALKAKMQGKSCFNFTVSDAPLLKELASLTMASHESYRDQGFV